MSTIAAMNKNRVFLFVTLFVGIGGGLLIAKYGSNGPVVPSSANPSPEVTSTTTRPTAAGRTARNLHVDKATNVQPELVEADQTTESAARDQLEQRFRNFREDGRKQFEDLVGGDREKMGRLFRSAFSNPEFQEIFQNSRAISEKWRTASDAEKPALMDQLTALRAKGLNIAKQELAKMDAPAAPVQPTVTIEGGTVVQPNTGTLKLGDGAQPAAPAPVIIM